MWTEQRRQTLWSVFVDIGKSLLLVAIAPTMRRFFYVDEVLHLRNIGSYVGQGHIEDLDTRWMDLAEAGEPPAGGK